MAIIKTKFDRGVEGATNIVDSGTEGTRVATGTTAQRGSTQGQIRFNTTTGLAEYYDGTGFKSIDSPPTVSSISPTSLDEADLSSNQTIVITGDSFSNTVTVTIIGDNGTTFTPASTTRNSPQQVTITTPTTLVNNNEPYDIKVENSSGLSGTLSNALSINDAPAFAVASGSLGTLTDNDRSASNLTAVTATDEENDSLTFSITSGSAPAGLTFNSNGTWSGTANAVSSDTTSNFTVQVTDGNSPATRDYSITVLAPIQMSYLIVAGGGGGGSSGQVDTAGGGGGAGGYRNSYASETSGGGGSTETPISLSAGVYTITVGGAGSAGAAGSSPGSTWNSGGTGGDSSIAKSGMTTITSNGGGGAGTYATAALNGGSGGGGGAFNAKTGGSGTSGQGFAGESTSSQGQNTSQIAGGGGGAAEAGGTDGNGQGGDGLASSITGSSVTRAGGGGGAGNVSSNGGAGGGGNGKNSGSAGGGSNASGYGSGGGGAYTGNSGTHGGGHGSAGTVILRLPTANYSGTTSGSPSVSTSGSDTILTFTGNGSYTHS
jgi:hypothetical protein